jgi:serine/threonine protein kinase
MSPFYMSKLLSQGAFGCVYYPGIRCDGKTDSRKNVVTKLQKRDFNADNEIKIGKLVRKIPNYRLFYLPVIKSCPVNLREIDNSIVSKCEIVSKSDKLKYVLMEIPYVSNSPFFDILTDVTVGKKRLILSMTESFRFLLDAIGYLLDIGVVHFDIKGENILYNTISNEPQLIDFGISIPINEISTKNMKDYFYIYAPEYYVWPLEVHIANFLLHETKSELTSKEASSIAALYTESNSALNVFSPGFKKMYLGSCKRVAERYVGKPRKETISALIAMHKTWDNYALSVMYLKSFKYLFSEGFHRNPMIIHFSQILLLNISPDFNKRLDIEETKKKFNDIFYIDDDVQDYIDLVASVDYDKDLVTEKINADISELTRISRIK